MRLRRASHLARRLAGWDHPAIADQRDKDVGGAGTEHLRAVAASIQDALVAADGASSIVFWSPGAQRTFGWSGDEALGRPLTMLMPERYRQAHREGIERVTAGGERHVLGAPPVALHGLHADGTEFPIELTLGTWEQGGERFYTGVVRDISDRRRMERILAAQYAVAAALAESHAVPDAVGRALEALGRETGWAAGQLWMVDGDELRLTAAWQHEAHRLAAFREAGRDLRFVRGVGLPGRVWASGRPLWLEDLLADENFPRLKAARAAGLRSAVGLPLVAEGETRGVLELFAVEVRDEDPLLLDAMAGLGNQLAQFLLRRLAEAELDRRERTQRQAAELNDEVVQGLVLAHYHLGNGDTARAAREIAATLDGARGIVSGLLHGAEVEPGALRRTQPARVPPRDDQ